MSFATYRITGKSIELCLSWHTYLQLLSSFSTVTSMPTTRYISTRGRENVSLRTLFEKSTLTFFGTSSRTVRNETVIFKTAFGAGVNADQSVVTMDRKLYMLMKLMSRLCKEEA